MEMPPKIMTDSEYLFQLTNSEEHRQARSKLEEEHAALMRLSIEGRKEVICQLTSGRSLLELVETHLASHGEGQGGVSSAIVGVSEVTSGAAALLPLSRLANRAVTAVLAVKGNTG